MKLFVGVFLALLVLEEYNCTPVVNYFGSYPLGRRHRFVTDCGFGPPHYHYRPFLSRPYYYNDWVGDYYDDVTDYNAQDYKYIDDLNKFRNNAFNKPTEKSSEKVLDKSSERPSEKFSEELLHKTSAKPSEKSSDQLTDEPLVPPMSDIPGEATTDIDLPFEP
ncbi:hypothetical protein PYW07_005715 [Mythimna separata]|uniref:Uncharacterized protein n=1 Tax=Mythimna separata TaxID=271217 RepID=A0AAD7YK07_MYTSE|nr:hypothetical protein PYW07_005715 [Mythimna separata]